MKMCYLLLQNIFNGRLTNHDLFVHRYITVRLLSQVAEKCGDHKMTKNEENVIVKQKLTFCCLKKIMMPSETPQNFFINSLRS